MVSKALRTIRMVAGISLMIGLTACAATGYEQEVALEAHWQCDVQHRAYTDVSEMEADLSERLTSGGISVERYGDFKAAMEASPDLRSETLAAYEVYCGITSDD
jgi:hypothetical protein